MSGTFKRNGSLFWDETVKVSEVSGIGPLEQWRRGEVGGATEFYHATLITKKDLTNEDIEAIEKETGIRSGSPFHTSRPQVTRHLNSPEGFYCEIHWVYCPSTE